MDWDGTSTISAPYEIVLAPFDTTFRPFGTGDIQQPGTSQRIDGQGGIISYMANYRSFADHNSFVINFNVDIDGNDTSGIRWVELRNNGSGPLSLYQEGTWTLADGNSRFMGSNSMDEEGNISLAYSVGSATTKVGLRFTGRMDGDPLGDMTYPETSIIESPGIQTFIHRYGDYAHTTIDLDNRTFWYVSEFFPTTNTWADRVAAFRFIDDYTNDVGVHNIAAPWLAGPYGSSETVEVSVINYGTSSQSNFDLELYVDGSLVATETFAGTLAAGESANYTFAQTIDLSIEGHVYEVEARTALGGDEYVDNDEFKRNYSYGVLGVVDSAITENELFMYPVADKQYELKYATQEDLGNLNFRILNMLGQEFTSGAMETENGGYRTSVNMNSAATGVYIIEVSNGTQKASKRIMIQ
ncbi:MAG: CARDB domain-containing protein [Flavobacteriaceae bacterium]